MTERGLDRVLADLRISLIFLSRLPLRQDGEITQARLLAAFGQLPLAGLVLHGLGGLVLYLAVWLGLDPLAAAALALLAMALLTGAFHEDALMDVSDGFGGGQTVAQKLEIMRDSRVGSYATVAGITTLLLKAALLAQITTAGGGAAGLAALMASGALSRGAIVWLMGSLPPAREDGLSAEAGRPAADSMRRAVLLATLLPFICLAWPFALAILPAAALAAFIWSRICLKQIGGQTGDALGAGQQMTDLAVLLTLAALTS